MSSHVALETYDILQHIFEQLSLPLDVSPMESFGTCYAYLGDRRYSLQTFARFARVCKFWSDPALRILWKQLSSIRPLLRLVVDDPTSLSNQGDLVSIRLLYQELIFELS